MKAVDCAQPALAVAIFRHRSKASASEFPSVVGEQRCSLSGNTMGMRKGTACGMRHSLGAPGNSMPQCAIGHLFAVEIAKRCAASTPQVLTSRTSGASPLQKRNA
jgi:hypothetical protein